MKQIELTQNKYAIVDDEDFGWLMQYHWWFDGNYAVREKMINRKKRKIYLHRQLMNFPKNKLIDHKNLNKLDD